MSINILSNPKTDNVKHKCYDINNNKILGFWIYLMSDCILFATLFASYAVLKNNIASGPASKDIFELLFVLVETYLLLFSSITYSIAMLNIYSLKKKKQFNFWMSLTLLFGFIFICMEIYELNHLVVNNYGPNRSAFLSAFFILISTHGLHVISGLIWILVMMVHICRCGLTLTNQIRLQCLGLFWHFLDVIWICVFSLVYLMGSI